MANEEFFEKGYDRIKENLGTQGCIIWILVAIFKIFQHGISLFSNVLFWIFIFGGIFLAASLMIPWYFVIRAVSRSLVKSDNSQYIYKLRWLFFLASTIYMVFWANLAFSILFS